MQAEIGAAALVRYGKPIPADPNLAPSDNGKADTSRSDNDDSPVSRAMRPDTGDRRIMSVNDRAERMRPQHELLECAFAAYPGKADTGVNGAERVTVKSGLLERDATGFFHFNKRAIDSKPQCGGAGNAASEETPICILDARATSGAAAIDPGEQESS
jgi:hypothetical protein